MKMTAKVLFSVLLVLLLAVSSVATAGDYSDPDSGVSISIPDTWAQKADEDMLMIGSPDEKIVVFFFDVDAAEAEKALDMLDALVKEHVEITKEGKPEEGELNGMKAMMIEAEGKAKEDGTPVEIGGAIVQSPTGKALILIGIGEPDSLKANEKELEAIFSSLKPIAK